MVKTFIFSVFVHVLNMVWITLEQLDVIQKMLVDFLWRGWSKIYLSVICNDLLHSSLKMLYVKNFMHNLRVKWMQ